jgi:hypothetical protein
VKDARAHLVCFAVRGAVESVAGVATASLFDAALTMDVLRARELCVPSTVR